MNNVIRVLIVENYPFVAEMYKDALRFVEGKNKEIYFDVCIASSCENAFEIIMNKLSGFDLFFLDMNLPISKGQRLITYYDIINLIHQKFSKSKIIAMVSVNDNFIFTNIIKKVKPIAFLVKNETTKNTLITTIESVLKGYPFYSPSALQLLKDRFISEINIDEIDQKMLYELSLGTKMKELPEILPLSMAALERRKRQLKKAFNLDTENDRNLLAAAKKYGYI